MNKKLILPIILIAVTAVYFLGKSRLKKIKVLFRGLKVTGGLLKPKFNLKFGLQNPTNETANFKSLIGEVYANGKLIANVSDFQKIKIESNKETQISVIADPVAITIVKTIVDFVKNRNKLNIEFKGSANIDNIVYPLNNQLSI
jgi:hypothetical protein